MKFSYLKVLYFAFLISSLVMGGSSVAFAQSSYCAEYPTEPIKRPMSPYIIASLNEAWNTYGSFLNAPEYDKLRGELSDAQLTVVEETFDSLTQYLPEAPSYQGYAQANPDAQIHDLARFSTQRVVVPILPIKPGSPDGGGQGKWMSFLERWDNCNISASDFHTKYQPEEIIIDPRLEYEVLGDICSDRIKLRVRVMREGGFSRFDIENIVESITHYLEGNSPPSEMLQGSQSVGYEFSSFGKFIVDPTRVALAACRATPSLVDIRFEVAQHMGAFAKGEGIVLRVSGRISNDTVEIVDLDRAALQKLVEIVSERQADRARRLAILKNNRRSESPSSNQSNEFDTIWNSPALANQALMLGLMGIANAWYEGSPCINPDSQKSGVMDGCR